jgi:hypothetical protein
VHGRIGNRDGREKIPKLVTCLINSLCNISYAELTKTT